MNNTTTQSAFGFSEIGQPYGRSSRIATVKEMATAPVVGSKCGEVMVEKQTKQAWKWSSFGFWVTMDGWTGEIKKTRKGFAAVA